MHKDGSLSTPEVMKQVAKLYDKEQWEYLAEQHEFQCALLQFNHAKDVHIVARRLLRRRRKQP
jgi:hypothetical protein